MLKLFLVEFELSTCIQSPFTPRTENSSMKAKGKQVIKSNNSNIKIIISADNGQTRGIKNTKYK